MRLFALEYSYAMDAVADITEGVGAVSVGAEPEPGEGRAVTARGTKPYKKRFTECVDGLSVL